MLKAERFVRIFKKDLEFELVLALDLFHLLPLLFLYGDRS